MVYAIVALAVSGFGFAATALAFGVRKGQLEADRAILRSELATEEQEHETTMDELAAERDRSTRQLEFLRDEINDQADLLAMCTDPAVILDRFDLLLQKATGRFGDQSHEDLL